MGAGASRQFLLKYAGVAPAERACSAPAMAAAVAQVIAQNKGSTKKLRRVTVTVSPKGISVEDATTSERILDVSIYRISYCSADAMHCTVFAFIAQGSGESLECHAFLCRKRKVARTVTLSAAQSFNTAYQVWQGNQDRKKMVESSVRNQKRKEELLPPTPPVGPKALLIDFSDDLSSTSPWVSFEEEGSSNLWDQAPAVPHHIISSDRLLAC